MPFVPPSNPKCPKCDKSVYAAEKACFVCTTCNKSLDSTTQTENEGKVYCKACYGKNFGPKGFGYAGGGAMMHAGGPAEASAPSADAPAPAPQMSSLSLEEPAAKDEAANAPCKPVDKPKPAGGGVASSFGSGANKCPRCGKSVYAAEKALGPGGDWHKLCLKCPDCNKLLDSTTLTENNGEVYCKACYAKRFGPKGFGFAGGAAMMHSS